MTDKNLHRNSGMDATNDINERMYNRNLPDHMMKPAFSSRPLPTKYVLLSDAVLPPPEVKNDDNYTNYSVSKGFNPGNRMSPWDGFSENINIDSALRNQYDILGCNDNDKWIPSTKSDMYREYRPPSTYNEVQPFPRLFATPMFNEFNPNTHNPSEGVWGNHTRQQLKQKVTM